MFDVILDSAKLFFTGRMFQNYTKVFQLFAVGVACGLLVFLVIGALISPLVGALVGGGVSGAVQPFLFKDLKYK